MKLTGYMKLIEQSVNNREYGKVPYTCCCMPFGKLYSDGILLRKVDKTYLFGFYRLLGEENKQEHCKKERHYMLTLILLFENAAILLGQEIAYLKII